MQLTKAMLIRVETFNTEVEIWPSRYPVLNTGAVEEGDIHSHSD